MFKFWKIIWVMGLLLMPVITVHAKSTHIDSVRYWIASDYTRMVFDVTRSSSQKVFVLQDPARLVVDFYDTKLNTRLVQPSKDHALFKRIRTGVRNKKNLRVVFELKESVKPKYFSLKPRNKKGHRFVIDLFTKTKIFAKQVTETPTAKKSIKTVKNNARDIIVAIDAGHGGKDPGSTGPNKTQEKKVVFEIAKKLASLINKKPGMKAVLVRKGDYFIKLKQRMEIARKAKADLFISIHADAFTSSKVKGASVYTLSESGASTLAAKWLANHENSVDLMGGVVLAGKEETLASVLMDLSQTATKEASRDVAGNILKYFKKIGALHQNHVQKAGFMVLKSPDIPAVLVETAFISNPAEERKLNSYKHQKKMANAIFKGIVAYFNEHAPADTYLAQYISKKHVISSGETLSGIAEQYGVPMKRIKSFNALASNRIRIGQVLKIPRV